MKTIGAGKHSVVPRAFRYVILTGDAKNVTAWLELLDETPVAKFSCDKPEVGKIFDICRYTFHLNCREFMLDGIQARPLVLVRRRFISRIWSTTTSSPTGRSTAAPSRRCTAKPPGHRACQPDKRLLGASDHRNMGILFHNR